jgi:hypothetical protein
MTGPASIDLPNGRRIVGTAWWTTGINAPLHLGTVTVLDTSTGRHKAYIGAVPGGSHDGDATAIADRGARLDNATAQVLFPWLPLHKWDPDGAESQLVAALEQVLTRHREATTNKDNRTTLFRCCCYCAGHPAWPCPDAQAALQALGRHPDTAAQLAEGRADPRVQRTHLQADTVIAALAAIGIRASRSDYSYATPVTTITLPLDDAARLTARLPDGFPGPPILEERAGELDDASRQAGDG